MRTVKLVVIICSLLFLFSSCKISDSKYEQNKIAYNIPEIETTTMAFQIIENNKIQLSTLSFCFPQNYEILSSNGEVVLQNKSHPIQLTVEDKTNEIEFYDDYIQETIASLKNLGLSPQTIESVKIGDYSGKRFIVDTFDIENSEIRMFCYFLEVKDSKVLVNVISIGREIVESLDADMIVSSIKFE